MLARGGRVDARQGRQLSCGPGSPVDHRQAHHDAAAIGQQPGETGQRISVDHHRVEFSISHRLGRSARRRDRAMPASATIPPTTASSGGRSPSNGHEAAIVSGGTR